MESLKTHTQLIQLNSTTIQAFWRNGHFRTVKYEFLTSLLRHVRKMCVWNGPMTNKVRLGN